MILSFFGHDGVAYRIGASGNLKSWCETERLTGSDGLLILDPSVDETEPQMFHRVSVGSGS